ncbi:McrC family protein [Gluconacetobacter entanii]|uniref:McrC family protein n=1 Tax=Gluconacetobacter entanii TaxID=108528 RepID=UPI001C935D13|nr:McrC family protein [Gluconacetobacter entanii]MBY4638984.1 McrC family protein [Gluconacetobacter entanii]MCW4580404.1 McrC family protein [Gluconacetobacter entanii]MCW4583750.1 McrC family protein [Gluconacetobacter entanii]MCW4587096.1 McrC family protein [Gluconacetobacter entanii]
MIHRTVLEWNTLPYGSGQAEIPRDIAERLVTVAENSAMPGALQDQRHGLRACGMVGMIVAPGAELEILPKIDTPQQHGVQAVSSIRRRLVHMLAVVLDINVADGDIAHLGTQEETLLEVLIRLFSRRLSEAVKPGLPRRYVEQADDLPALRGRLDVTRQFSVLAVSPQKLACRYDEMACDTPLNQIMKAAVERLLRLSRAADNQRRLRELAFVYADVSPVAVSALRWDRVVLDRTTTRWKTPLKLARLLLGQRFQTTSGGVTQGFSLLFEMNVLFEKYIARRLRTALAGTGLHAAAQKGRRYALYTPEEKGVFQTIPDILIKRGDAIVQIVDTKWKCLARQDDDPKQGVSQVDIYQMMAYARIYDCPRLMLLYPHHAGLGVDPVCNTHYIATPSGPDVLEVATIDISDNAALLRNLRMLCADGETGSPL